MSNIRLGDGPWLKGAKGRRSMIAAKRFSLFSTALTEEDPPELQNLDERIAAAAKPVGELENLLVDLISLTYLRMQRCNRAEAELNLATWAKISFLDDDDLKEERLLRRENGLRVTNFRPEKFNEQIHLVEVCQMRLAHCLFRSLNELERLQRMRRGETIPAPIVGAMEITNENVIRVARGRGGRFAPLQEKQVQPPSEKFEKTNPI